VLNDFANADCDLTDTMAAKRVNTQLAAIYAVFWSGCRIAMVHLTR